MFKQNQVCLCTQKTNLLVRVQEEVSSFRTEEKDMSKMVVRNIRSVPLNQLKTEAYVFIISRVILIDSKETDWSFSWHLFSGKKNSM